VWSSTGNSDDRVRLRAAPVSTQDWCSHPLNTKVAARVFEFRGIFLEMQDSLRLTFGPHCGPNDAISGEKLRLHFDPAQGLGGRDDGDALEAF
jgi:hypothetical protein